MRRRRHGERAPRALLTVYDGTQLGAATLAVACDLAAARQLHITVLLVVPRPRVYSESLAESAQLRRLSEQRLRRLRREILAFCDERELSPSVVVARQRLTRAVRRERRRRFPDITVAPVASLALFGGYPGRLAMGHERRVLIALRHVRPADLG
jgi:hypothetical protein